MDVRLTRQARDDLEEIKRYTIGIWGQDQWRRYFVGLAAVLERVTSDKRCGRPRDALRANMCSFAYQKHLIFFEPIAHAGGEVVILRIVHQRRDLAALSFHDKLEEQTTEKAPAVSGRGPDP
jgi:toxin ParE1/3/4